MLINYSSKGYLDLSAELCRDIVDATTYNDRTRCESPNFSGLNTPQKSEIQQQ